MSFVLYTLAEDSWCIHPDSIFFFFFFVWSLLPTHDSIKDMRSDEINQTLENETDREDSGPTSREHIPINNRRVIDSRMINTTNITYDCVSVSIFNERSNFVNKWKHGQKGSRTTISIGLFKLLLTQLLTPFCDKVEFSLSSRKIFSSSLCVCMWT